ncbi:MAG: PSD1 and planctomycete cytochrome C domain-containing protein [Limisphaerales bacterium]
MIRVPFITFALSVGLFVSLPVAPRAAADKDSVDFGKQVLPIISSKCFHCHGQDEHSRKAKLRLDVREEAIKERKDGVFAIKAGDVAKSELVKRITSTDPDEVMPPPKEAHPVSAAEVALLKKWIQQGAPYQKHWAFVAPVRPAVPAVKYKKWARNDIDRFILARLESERLKPSAPAEKSILLRRVSLDLTGLPPSAAELEAFLKDKAPNAYERVVDRLLASPRYGERWARMWLDIARYADSAGYGSDPLRLNIWPYRDWVIKAFNRNMPFDEFTMEQLAGDLMENATEDEKVATAFHRNTMTNTEGGTEDEEWRVAAVKDRADVTVQAWMGLTMGCAQCHSHKFDPITQKEYYQFFAIFNQTEDSDKADERPTMPLYKPEERKKIQELDGEIGAKEKILKASNPAILAELATWEKERPDSNAWTVLEPVHFESEAGGGFKKLADNSLLATNTPPVKDNYTVVYRAASPPPHVGGYNLGGYTALRLDVLEDDSLPAHGPGRNATGNFLLNHIEVTVNGKAAKIARATATFTETNYSVGATIEEMSKPKKGWSVDGTTNKNQSAVFEFAERLPAGDVKVKLVQQYGKKQTIGRFRISGTTLATPVIVVPEELAPVLAIKTDKRSAEQKAALAKWFRPFVKSIKEQVNAIAALKTQRDAIKPVDLPVMRELPVKERRVSHILFKGSYLAPGDEVSAGVPAAFNPWPAGAPTNRLGVAKWLMSPENPLTARVVANRFWAQIFGRGIVETEEDFGTQGTKPTHPELLDWLALELRDNGWNIKQFLKMLVMSATYQQSSRVTPELLAKDPRNYLLARAPRRRLDAEFVRDQALALSGLLSPKIGGPSVYPPQPDNLWRAAFNGERSYPTSTGEDKYRRGIYTFWRRTIPHPSMATFDAPSRETCTFRRLPTNTPLQAYVTLNDPIYVEAAQSLGRRLAKVEAATLPKRMEYGLKLVLCRQPTKREVASLCELYESEVAHYSKSKDEAVKLSTNPLGPLPEGLTPAEAAAWTTVANILLNLDGLLMKG